MDRLPKLAPLVGAGALAALACANPFADPPAGDVADVATPPPEEPPAEAPPPGGWIERGVIYDKDGSVYGCVGGGNACAGPPAGQADDAERELDLCGAVDAIRDAQLEHRDRTGRYLAVAATPRAAERLDETAVAVPAAHGFVALGWTPPSPTRATFWVDLSDGGFEAHGLARVRADTWLHCFATAEQGAVDTPWRPR